MNAFISPRNIYHGEGSLQVLETILKKIDAQSIFLLTDPI